ncbi:PREDICTED: methyl-CpG-binding domain protein 2-like [Rhagoletis zephyria]|uniref:methyl-CpG-binding domain protein 2-like n=1 Tax=Rhagoletis zephyria TaxID=28612 RepID=UPI0008115C6A|nr:PREDICTED: methyl-CpG-binding domain protein 2-like [Rhagoletis zephyria]
MDNSLTPPIRQNSGVFKRPVKVVSSQPGSSVLNWNQIKDYFKRNNLMLAVEPKLENPEKPYQVFWQKRLQGISTTRPLGELADFQLPVNMKAFMASLADNESLLRSLTASLHLGTTNIRGQEKSALQKKRDPVEGDQGLSLRNPVAFVNPQQPLILSTTVTDEDIRRQEEVVAETRMKLVSAIRDGKLISA